MNKRFQIFVSSTFKDLEKERSLIIEAIITKKHFPAGMEYFSASSDEQFDYIKKILVDCDYYILITAGRYGSMNAEGKSYTHLEYEYAKELEIPILCFYRENIKNLPEELQDEDLTNINNFHELVKKSRMCRSWSDIGQLMTRFHSALDEEIAKDERIGWQRFVDESENLKEIQKLYQENSTLQKSIKELEEKIKALTPRLDALAFLDSHYKILPKGMGVDKNIPKFIQWKEIFRIIGVSCLTSASINDIQSLLEKAFLPNSDNFLMSTRNHIDTSDINTIIIEFIKYGFLEPSKDGFCLTDSGRLCLQEITTKKSIQIPEETAKEITDEVLKLQVISTPPHHNT